MLQNDICAIVQIICYSSLIESLPARSKLSPLLAGENTTEGRKEREREREREREGQKEKEIVR